MRPGAGGVSERVWSYGLTLEGPILSRGLKQRRLGLDASFARDPVTTKPVLHGTLLRGLVRHVMMDIADHTRGAVVNDGDIEAWFGGPSNVGNEPRRGRVEFQDLTTETPTIEEEERTRHEPADLTRIALDRDTGSVREGHLQTIELLWPVGHRVTFTGKVRLIEDAKKGDTARFEEALALALEMLPAVGAFRSAGFGRVLEAIPLKKDETPSDSPGSSTSAFTGWTEAWLVLRFLDPFCVDARLESENVFEGSPVVPGAVLKGTVARRLRAPRIDEWLENVIFGHARPVSWNDEIAAGQVPLRPRPTPPFSLVRCGDCGFLHDLFEEPAPGVRAPRFQIDWKSKEFEALPGIYQAPRPEHEARTRTAIHPERGGADPAKLFSYLAVVPTPDVRWVARLRRGRAAADDFENLLERLHGSTLHGIGKTSARATLEVRKPEPKSPVAYETNHYVLCLETPALLNDTDELRLRRSIAEDYAEYFKQASSGALELVADGFFARQRLAGGHVAIRYPRAALRNGWPPPGGAQPTPYEPYLLTEPGSVFRLRVKAETEARACVQSWLDDGLPLNPCYVNATWRTCPFLPENGFGQVRCVERNEHLKEEP